MKKQYRHGYWKDLFYGAKSTLRDISTTKLNNFIANSWTFPSHRKLVAQELIRRNELHGLQFVIKYGPTYFLRWRASRQALKHPDMGAGFAAHIMEYDWLHCFSAWRWLMKKDLRHSYERAMISSVVISCCSFFWKSVAFIKLLRLGVTAGELTSLIMYGTPFWQEIAWQLLPFLNDKHYIRNINFIYACSYEKSPKIWGGNPDKWKKRAAKILELNNLPKHEFDW
ncbi:MAG: hypothetical protein Q8Q23_02845 [bacterium]|nr:hypothetical protein [bacterium]